MDEQGVFEFLADLFRFEVDVSRDDFIEVFGDVSGSHLWYKYSVFCQGNIIHFWGILDTVNRVRLAGKIADFMKPIPF